MPADNTNTNALVEVPRGLLVLVLLLLVIVERWRSYLLLVAVVGQEEIFGGGARRGVREPLCHERVRGAAAAARTTLLARREIGVVEHTAPAWKSNFYGTFASTRRTG